MRQFEPPAPPYVGPAAHTSAGSNKPISRIVLHSTVSPCEEGGARKIAAYFRSQSAGGSAHYVVDCGGVVQVVGDSTIAWHAPPNAHSLGIEMCDMPSQDVKRWDDKSHQAMLRLAATLTAQLCLAYDVPVKFLSTADLRAGKHGITTHNNVSQAWHESTHWDPGAWPQGKFMRLVKAEVRRLKKPADTTEELWFYNLDNGRPDRVVNREIRKILANKPLVLVGAEATGLNVDEHPDYHLIRDRSNKSRENMVVFVRKDARFRFAHWIDLRGTWPRTKYSGVHEPRAFPVFWVNGLKFVGVHLPPRNARPRIALQTEALDHIAKVKPDVAIGDFNGRKGDPDPGPDTLARQIGGRTIGGRIDCAVVADDLKVHSTEYPTRVGRVFKRALGSDHGRALRVTLDS